MSIEKFADTLRRLGCEVTNEEKSLLIDIDSYSIIVDVDDEWEKSINGFYRAKQYSFDQENMILTANKFVEFQVVRLDPNYFSKPVFDFSDIGGDKVTVSTASNEFALSFLNSEKFIKSFELVKRRIKRRCDRNVSSKKGRVRLRMENLLLIGSSATFCPKKKFSKEKIVEVGRTKIKACLFNLAFEKGECYELREAIKSRGLQISGSFSEDKQLEIPHPKYNDDMVAYYKIAKSSMFAGQAFLSYYHILEYNFLIVTDDILFQKMKTQINKPNFKATYSSVNNLISTIKKYDNTNDETEMLKAVLNKYIDENEFIEFVKDIEESIDEKHYSKPKSTIFGEKLAIRLEEGHALSNAAKVLKHIRNALVHSSDRYTREDCFKPFSESESIVYQYIPLVKYLAEKTIFSSAE